MSNFTEEFDEPDWDGLREQGHLLVDHEYDKLAVFVGDQGHVVIAQSCGAPPADAIAVEAQHIPALVKALLDIQQAAKEREAAFWQEVNESYSNHIAGELIEQAAASARKVR